MENIKLYIDTINEVEEKLIDLKLDEEIFKSFEKTIAKNDKRMRENIGVFGVVYTIASQIFNHGDLTRVPIVVLIYAVLEVILYKCSNYVELKKLKKINVLDLEMELYDYSERLKGLRNACMMANEEKKAVYVKSKK